MPTGQQPFHFRQRPRLPASATNGLHALDGKLMFRFCRPPGFVVLVRQVREEDIAHERQGKRDDAVDYEQPSPAGASVYAVETRVCCSL